MSLSKRGQSYASSAPQMTIWTVIQNLWHPTTNPTGYVSLGVAENSLMHTELTSYINKHTSIIPSALTYCDGGAGSRTCRAAMAHFLNRKLYPVVPFTAAQICITNGVSTAIEHFSMILADPGDVFLLGQPHYGAFIDDLELRSGANVVKVSFDETDPLSIDAIEYYAAVIEQCQKEGKKVAGIMLCNPHNPLGRCYPREFLVELMRLCGKHEIHLISDEIYAMSVFASSRSESQSSTNGESGSSVEPTPFTSLSSIPTADLIDPSQTHILYGLSKDFGANGLRIGALISQYNPVLHDALIPVSIYSYPSSIAEAITTKLLLDDEYVDWYIAENCRRLKRNFERVVEWVGSRGMEWVEGVNAAFFLWVDLGGVRRRGLKSGGGLQRRNFDDEKDGLPDVEGLSVNGEGEKIVRDQNQSEPHNAGNPEAMVVSKEGLNDDSIVDTTEAEEAEIQSTLLEHKVFLASGKAFGAEKPGWFRIVFSQETEVLEEGLRRIERALGLETR